MGKEQSSVPDGGTEDAEVQSQGEGRSRGRQGAESRKQLARAREPQSEGTGEPLKALEPSGKGRLEHCQDFLGCPVGEGSKGWRLEDREPTCSAVPEDKGWHRGGQGRGQRRTPQAPHAPMCRHCSPGPSEQGGQASGWPTVSNKGVLAEAWAGSH